MLVTVCGFAHGPNKPVTAKQSYSFLENKGQWDKNILFRADIPQGQLFITKQGLSYKLQSDIPATVQDSSTGSGPHSNSNRNTKGHLINVSFEGASSNFQIITSSPELTSFHFIKGKTNWVNNAKAYKEIKLQNLYDGIDLKLYFKDNLLKYDFIVQPGKDFSKIGLVYKGADSLYLEDNHLVIQTSIGKIYEKPPFTYQYHSKRQKEIPCKFKLNGSKLKFEISGYYNHQLPLIIDPELIFSTYSGSTADNFGNTATYDDDGNMYTGGIIFNESGLPVTPGPLGQFMSPKDYNHHDAFIMKYSNDGKSLLHAVYLGGFANEYPVSMIVNKKKELIIMGVTSSTDFPVTLNAFDTTYNGGLWFDSFFNFDDTLSQAMGNGSDLFITKLSTATFDLISSTYLGGTNNDGVQISGTDCVKNYGDQLRGEIMTDHDNGIYILTQTYSNNLNGVLLTEPFHFNNGLQDALLVKFSSDLDSVIWHRMIGGSGYESGLGVRVDSLKKVYITGGTSSANLFGSGASGYKKSYSGNVDGYIACISADGKSILSSTYLGTESYDQSYLIDIDKKKNVYVIGQTKGVYEISNNVYNNPGSGQFLHKFSNDLSSSLMSTVFGSGSGSPDISFTAFLVNDCQKIFISGWGGKTNNIIDTIRYNRRNYLYNTGYVGGTTNAMPITADAIQKQTTGHGFYFIIFHPDARTLAYATHFGGIDRFSQEHVDGGTSRFDKKGIIYQSICAGCGSRSNFPTPVPGVWSMTNNSYNCNNASLKFDLGKVVAKFETFDSLKQIPSVYGCVPLTFFVKNKSSGATNYKWNVGSGQFFEKNDSLFLRFTERGKQNITLIAFDTTICRLTDTARAVINAGDVKVDFAPDKTVCFPGSFIPKTKLYTPWAKVNWTPTTGISDPTSPNPTITTSTDINYVITVNDDTLCVKSDTLKVKVRKTSPSVDFQIWDMDKTGEKYTYCYPNTGFFRNLAQNYDYLEWKEDNINFQYADSFYYQFPKPGVLEYKLVVHDTICNKILEKIRTAILSFPLVTFPDDIVVCPNSVIDITVTGDPGYKYKWSPGKMFTDSTSQQQQIKVFQPGTVFINVSDSIGCETNDTVQYSPFSIPELIAEEEAKICMKKYGGAEITSVTLKDYLWDPVKFEGNPYYATSKGTYVLSGHTLDGCPVRDTVKVIEKCDPSLHVPTAFTPNGDGNNDFFSVFGYEVAKFDIKVFNRWGEIIYHSTDFKFKWDGTYRNETVPIGTYPYIISWGGSTFEGTEVSEKLTGDITVVR